MRRIGLRILLEEKPLAKSDVAYIALTMTVSAALTAAVEYWPGKHPSRDAPASSLMQATSARAAVLDPVPATMQAAQPGSPAPVLRTEPITAPAAASENPPEVLPMEPLPVAFHIRNRRDMHEIDGVITNISSNTLAITLRAIRAGTQTTSEMSFQLAPGERKTYSSNDGLDMQSNDQLVVQSPPYQDRVVQVP
jgi:hypothetical protein